MDESSPKDYAGPKDHSRQALRDEAFDLACQAFDDATDDHVHAVYERLDWNRRRGLGNAGVLTVH